MTEVVEEDRLAVREEEDLGEEEAGNQEEEEEVLLRVGERVVLVLASVYPFRAPPSILLAHDRLLLLLDHHRYPIPRPRQTPNPLPLPSSLESLRNSSSSDRYGLPSKSNHSGTPPS